jgi:predicted acyltransferase
MTTSATDPSPSRIQSIDQFRGYAIFGMMLVNFFGHYETKWVDALSIEWLKRPLEFIFGEQLHHHNHFMTYADTIAPIFMFVVGIGLRISWLKKMEKVPPNVARKSLAGRYFTLVLIGFAIYSGWIWDALMSIGLAGLVGLLVVDKKWTVRIAFAVGLLAAYQLIFSYTSYGIWLLRLASYGDGPNDMPWPLITIFLPLREVLLDVRINGGPLGHWSWAFILIMGTIAYDIVATGDRRKILTGLTCMGLILTVGAWGIRAVGTKAYFDEAEPWAAAAMLEGDFKPAQEIMGKSHGMFSSIAKENPEAKVALESGNFEEFARVAHDQLTVLAAQKPAEAPRFANAWVFSKNYLTIPFPLWSAAIAVFTLLAFYIFCDILKLNVPGMAVVGLNPLFLYIFQSLTLQMYGNLNYHWDYENTTSGLFVLGSFVVYWGLMYAMARYLYNRNIVIKI